MSLSEYDLYRVLQEEHGGVVIPRAEWAKFPHVHAAITERLAREFELTDEEHRELTQARGGCRCQDPGAMPPCGVCTDPPSLDEIETFALIRRAERQPTRAPVMPEGWGDW